MENVVTHSDYRGKGYATQCLNYAREIAQGDLVGIGILPVKMKWQIAWLIT